MLFANEMEACRAWVQEFDAIPQSVIEKLMTAYYDDGIGEPIEEITPPALYDRVNIFDDEWSGMSGEIIETEIDGEADLYMIKLDHKDDEGRDEVVVSSDCFDVIREDELPMWGTMWAFGDSIDNDWLGGMFGENNIQKMADAGFRIYRSEDWEYIFGIDGAGYDFYESHWLPLYRARGLKWHREDPVTTYCKGVTLNDDCSATVNSEFNGIKLNVELNSADVCKLFYERERAFYLEDILSEIESRDSEYSEEDIAFLKEHLNLICSIYEDARSNDESWYDDVSYAIDVVLSQKGKL